MGFLNPLNRMHGRAAKKMKYSKVGNSDYNIFDVHSNSIHALNAHPPAATGKSRRF